ncbi:MAG: tetratricopeptide repeat protein [Proteobacteria bacterium]|nr:tetratricopeptide repeat protein [Pseudomonadota bacterium]
MLLMPLFAVAACTTRMGQANKLLEAGLNQEAEAAFEKILQSDPDNADAKIGLAKSRSALWRKELVSIRLMRMSGDGKGALVRLEALLEKIRIWDVSSFQSGELVSAEEEVRNARRILTGMIQQKITEKQPVVAIQYWNDFNQVREAKQFGSYSVSLLEDIRSEGRESCKKLQGWITPVSFSFNSVAKAVCAYFGGQMNAVPLDFQQDYRYSKIVFSGGIRFRNFEGDGNTQVDILRNEVEQKIPAFGLYASESPHTLNIAASGEFVRDYSSRNSIKAHSYKIKVPYQDYENYEEKEYATVYRDGKPQTVERPVQKTRPVTRFRTEPRTHRYPAVDHTEKLRLNFALTAKTAEESSLAFAQEKENNFVTHDQQMPDIGLLPAEPKFLVVTDWLAGHFAAYAEQFVGKLAVQTGDRFCQAVKGQDTAKDSAESFSRCAELNPKNVAAKAWFTGQFGVTRAEVLQILSKQSQ